MRFKLDFIVCKDHPNKGVAFLNQKNTCLDDFGETIGKTFEWKQVPDFSKNVDMERHRLELLVFSVDQWIEFKQRLFTEIYEKGRRGAILDQALMLELIKELESFGKPAEAAKG